MRTRRLRGQHKPVPPKLLQADSGLEEVILEYIVHGHTVKVSAIDPKTLIEASIVGTTRASRSELDMIAIRKLIYVIRNKKLGGETASTKRNR